jgi:proteasome accessory factor B
MNLISFLLRQDEHVPISSIIGAVKGYDDGASRDSLLRRFERDKQVLRDMHVPVEYQAPSMFGVEGYRISKKSYYLGEVKLPQNGAALLSALFSALGPQAGELSDDLRSVLIKLGFEAGEDPAEAVMLAPAGDDPAEGHHLDLKLGSSAQVGRNLEVLTEAALRRKRVSMRYYTISRDETTQRDVDPYGLGYAGQAWNRGAWYLVGYCHLREAVRIFKLDRIRGTAKIHAPDADAPDFAAPESFNIRDYLNKARWEMRELAQALGGGPARAEDVLVRFPAGVASAIRELVPSAEVDDAGGRSEKGVVLRFHVQERRAFCRFLLPYVEHLEVVSPPDMRDSLADLAREILARYAETPEGASS